jgi:ComF family protein
MAAYDGAIKAAIRALKYDGERAVGRVLADLLVAHLPGDWVGRVTAVTAVPLHPSRQRDRGFNQAEMLAQPVARALAVPYWCRALVRRRQESAQAGLDARARRLNVVGAFDASRVPEASTVLLVDDVFSTGATADACAAALKRAGASAVVVQTLARAVLGRAR